MKFKPSLYAISLLLVLIWSGCRLNNRPNWDSTWTAPLINSDIQLLDALSDSSIFQVGGDNTVQIVLRDTIVDFKLNEFVEIPDTSLEATVNLDSIRLTSDAIQQRSTVWDVTEGTQYEQIVLQLHQLGYVPTTLPGFLFTNQPPYAINASNLFDWAVLETGELAVTISNHFPMDILSVEFDLVNAVDQSQVAQVTFGRIARFETKTEIASLAGKYMESDLEAVVNRMEFDDLIGGTPFNKDTQYIDLSVVLQNMVADSAKAVFPEQNVIDEKSRIKWDFGPGGIELTRLELGGGRLEVTAFSNIGNPMEFTYRLPSARKNGNAVEVVNLLPAGSNANPSEIQTEFDLTDYQIDLTINGDSVNLFPQEFLGRLIYTGQSVIMSDQSRIDISYKLLDLVPRYVEGYIGKQQFSFSDSVALDFFEGILGGYLDLVKPSAELVVENSVGADGLLKLNQLEGRNSRTGDRLTLTGQEISGALEITGPRMPNVGAISRTNFALNAGNSNIRDFFRLFPDEISVDIDVEANHNGVPALHNNFATSESGIRAMLDVMVPLYGVAEALLIEKDLEFNLGNAELPVGAEAAKFRLVTENYFPVQTRMQVYFRNGNGQVLDSLFTRGAQRLPPAAVDAGLVVTSPGSASLETELNAARLEKIKTATTATVQVYLNTSPAATAVRLYADSRIDFSLVGDFSYGL